MSAWISTQQVCIKLCRIQLHVGLHTIAFVCSIISKGILAGIWPCGIITLLNELYISESKSQVYGAIHSFHADERSYPGTDLSKKFLFTFKRQCWFSFPFTEYICRDDRCHLRGFAQNPNRWQQSSTSQRIADLEIVVDKMHFKGHTDS